MQNTAHRPSMQASYTASRARPKRKISCSAAQIAATLTISFPRWRHMSLTSYWGQQQMSLTSGSWQKVIPAKNTLPRGDKKGWIVPNYNNESDQIIFCNVSQQCWRKNRVFATKSYFSSTAMKDVVQQSLLSVVPSEDYRTLSKAALIGRREMCKPSKFDFQSDGFKSDYQTQCVSNNLTFLHGWSNLVMQKLEINMKLH